MTENQQFIPEDSFDIRLWLGRILANWYWFVISVVVFGGAAYLKTSYTDRVDQVQAKLMISQPQGSAQQFVLKDFGIAPAGNIPYRGECRLIVRLTHRGNCQ